MAATALPAVSPMQSEANATGRPSTSAVALEIGSSENSGEGPSLGRPKWASRMTLAPLPDNSAIVGAMRSMRVASETLPSVTGTWRSTRTSTRLPLMLPISSSVLKTAMPVPFRLKFAGTIPRINDDARLGWGQVRNFEADGDIVREDRPAYVGR